MAIRLLLVLMLLAAIASLLSGLVFLLRDEGRSDRVVRALTVRVAISLLLFVFLMMAFHFGWTGGS